MDWSKHQQPFAVDPYGHQRDAIHKLARCRSDQKILCRFLRMDPKSVFEASKNYVGREADLLRFIFAVRFLTHPLQNELKKDATTLKEEWLARALYEDLYCARGEMENRIKEQLMLFADRTSTAFLRSNQIRLYFSSVGYSLMQALRRLGLQGTELAQAQCATMRLKLLKIGALIRITVRRVWVSLAGGYPYGDLFRQVYAQLRAAPLPVG